MAQYFVKNYTFVIFKPAIVILHQDLKSSLYVEGVMASLCAQPLPCDLPVVRGEWFEIN